MARTCKNPDRACGLIDCRNRATRRLVTRNRFNAIVNAAFIPAERDYLNALSVLFGVPDAEVPPLDDMPTEDIAEAANVAQLEARHRAY